MPRQLLLLAVLGALVIGLTALVVRGIELFAAAGSLSAKTKGKILGYATSLPELVGTVGTAGVGLLNAGLWNVASSNIINFVLFTIAAAYHRRLGHAFRMKFRGEIGFSVLAFVIPLVLWRVPSLAASPWVAIGLVALFGVYIWVDQGLHEEAPPSFAVRKHGANQSLKRRGTAYMVIGVIGILVMGRFVGSTAEVVVRQMNVPEIYVGWILGFITSLPEMTAFFAVFASAKGICTEDDDTDCHENLDSLAASNMSNLGLIYPLGVATFLIVTAIH